MTRVLVVIKRPTIDWLSDDDRERLCAAGVTTLDRLRDARERHLHTVDCVREALAADTVVERMIDTVQPDDVSDTDLAVTVGGDGTVFAVQALLGNQPLLAVNSDPQRSVGHYTRCTSDTVAALVAAWRRGEVHQDRVHRLAVRIGDGPAYPILNDCLFTNANPAAMTRYRIRVGTLEELHHSSGVWISTAGGSTAAIASAGAPALSDHTQPALLYKVREPFSGRQRLQLLDGVQQPPQGLTLTAALPGLRLFLDGAHLTHDLEAGASAHFAAHHQDLRLLKLPRV